MTQPIPRRASRSSRSVAVVSATLVGLLVLACGLLAAYGGYRSSHTFPHPFWGLFNRSFTYTPAQGPPAAGLVDTRPDVLVLQYLSDYLRVAGTYPCAQDPSTYDEFEDPTVHGQPCPYHRPVAAFTVTSVYVGILTTMDLGEPGAVVRYQVSYADGERLVSTLTLTPHRYQNYFLAYIHQDCWDLPTFYPDVVPHVPRGVWYVTAGGENHCQP
jgi:hypothetical protein